MALQGMSSIILGIESSCDDTAAAVVRDRVLLSNVISDQQVHRAFGGVVPELASRAHQAHIIPVVDAALRRAGVTPGQVSAVAFTRGPGLLGALLVGTSFAKGFALARGIPLVEVNHLHGHILAHFIATDPPTAHPGFPFLCLLVSGGHTQIVRVDSPYRMEVLGRTIDDAAGETFDKCAKVMGLPYPGGPAIDRLAARGNPRAFAFAKPLPQGLQFSFSGLKTSFLYFLADRLRESPSFVADHQADLCASLQHTIITILMDKLQAAARLTGIKEIALAGGVAANSGLRAAAQALGHRLGWTTYIPEARLTTDNAAMIAIAGHYKYLQADFAPHSLPPLARLPF